VQYYPQRLAVARATAKSVVEVEKQTVANDAESSMLPSVKTGARRHSLTREKLASGALVLGSKDLKT